MISKQRKFIFGFVYCLVLVFTLCFSYSLIYSYINEKIEFEKFKQTWQYVADTNFSQSIEIDKETGEQKIVYGISTPEQLAGMFVHSNAVKAADVSDLLYELKNNITIGSGDYYSWSSSDLGSTLDGNGFVIYSMGSPLCDKITKKGTVKNLIFVNCYVSGNGVVANKCKGTIQNVTIRSSSAKGSGAVGGIAGVLDGGTIKNCIVDATITGDGSIGGVVGECINGSTISNCINYGSVSTKYDCKESISVGGIVGSFSTGTVELNVNRGNVSVSTSGHSVSAGGIIGTTITSFSNCSNYGRVTAKNNGTGKSHAGGVVGYTIASVSYCYNGGSVTSTANKNTDKSTSPTTITTSVSGNTQYSKQVTSSNRTSIYAQYLYSGTYTKTYSEERDTKGTYKSTSYPSKEYEYGTYSYCGGIAGYVDGSPTLSYCYNAGSVTSSGSVSQHVERVFKGRVTKEYLFLLTQKIDYIKYYTYGGICGWKSTRATVSSTCYNSYSSANNTKELSLSYGHTLSGTTTNVTISPVATFTSLTTRTLTKNNTTTKVDTTSISSIVLTIEGNNGTLKSTYYTGLSGKNYTPCSGKSGSPSGWSSYFINGYMPKGMYH